MSRAVAITGIGVVAPAGIGRSAFWTHLLEGSSPDPVAAIVRPGVPAPEAANVVAPDLEAERAVDARALRKVSEHTRLVTVAAALCAQDAGFAEGAREDTGICLGTCFGSSGYHLEYHEALRRRGVRGASALLFTQSVFNAATGHVGQVLDLQGGNLTLVGGESVGLEAVVRAAARVELGTEAANLAGGADQYCDLVHASLHQAGLVAGANSGGPGPWTEGACMVLVEDSAAAAARGARTYAVLLGSGQARRGASGSVRETVARAVAAACDAAHTEAGELDLVVACPPAGAVAAEHLEAMVAIDATFVAFPTVQLGQGFAFTSALGVAVGALAVDAGVVPPTRAHLPIDAHRTPDRPRAHAIERALVVATTCRDTVAAAVLAQESTRAAD